MNHCNKNNPKYLNDNLSNIKCLEPHILEFEEEQSRK